MSVVTGGLESLAPKLLHLLHDEYKLQKGVRKQVQWLHSELESIHAFLRKVSDVPWDRLDEQVKMWAREVREASYDMDDVLDTFLVRVDSSETADLNRLKRAMKTICNVISKAKARRDIADAVQDIKKDLEEVAQRRQKYKLDDIMCKRFTTTSTIDPRLKAMYKEVTQLIGVSESRDEVISMLDPSQLDHDASSKKMKKVSIVGVGGLGKTTLAKVVYDKLKSQYDCGAFVSVGRDHDLVKVLKDILFHLDKEKHEKIHNTGRGAELLIHQIRDFLEKKRYIVVIDDIWEVHTWETIELALVENNCGSKVITTTRNADVAKVAGEVYKLKPLSCHDSMKLFYSRIPGADIKSLDNQSVDVSEKILKKCGGIPLAIITMASLLADKQECEWSKVYNSIGFECEDNREAEDMRTILSFSYYDLSPQLRTCLLYLSTYPEDYFIKKDLLIWKWIAEGFIEGKQGTRLFELGERYFNDLINRSLIQVVEDQWDGRVLGCRVHDMVLDLMRKISIEENFIDLLGDNVEGEPTPSSARRLVQQDRTAEHTTNFEATDTRLQKVRSYTALMCCINDQNQFLRFKLLRVLEIVECSFNTEGPCYLERLGDLLHLRYLRIERCGGCVPALPKQIENLKLLQTLDVDGGLPASIGQLTKLLRLWAGQSNAPDGIGNLTSLEDLRIRLRSDSITERFMKVLGSLRELRMLRFSTDGMDKSAQIYFVESLRNLKKIQQIYVEGFVSEADTDVWEAAGFVLPQTLHYLDLFTHFSKMPSCINPSHLPYLSHLRLWVTTMDEQDLNLLARLPALCYLDLRTESTVTANNINDGSAWFFQKLRYMEIDKMIQFEQANDEDANVSLHMWNGHGAIPFGSRKSKESSKVLVPSGVMPNLQVLSFHLPLRALKDNNGACRDIGLEYLPCLQEVRGYIHCDGMSAEEMDAALDALRNECMVHPNHPTLNMDRWPWDKLKDSNVSNKENEKHQEAPQTADIDLMVFLLVGASHSSFEF